jgi:hypothetical protein
MGRQCGSSKPHDHRQAQRELKNATEVMHENTADDVESYYSHHTLRVERMDVESNFR